MDPILLLIPGLVYSISVIGIIVYWMKRYRKQSEFTKEDERLFEELLRRAAQDD